MSAATDTRALWQRSRFEWGSMDCILAVCDHVQRQTGRDPAAPWRGSYSDRDGAEAIYEQHGGVLQLFTYGMMLAGFKEAEPQDGFPVVCQVGPHEVAGVVFGRRVGFMAEGRGLAEMPAPILRAWAI